MKKLLALALALIMLASLGSALADDKVTVTFWYSLSGANADAIKEIGPLQRLPGQSVRRCPV